MESIVKSLSNKHINK
uniref:Uncharacterized protein n=1 Tax=Anguilla anguilla TaxID=7936 RepID=A0A0E9VFS8_ANGAN